MKIENRIKIALMSFYGNWIAYGTITIKEEKSCEETERMFSYMIETADRIKTGVAVLNYKNMIEIIDANK